jgi:hypothetical protein
MQTQSVTDLLKSFVSGAYIDDDGNVISKSKERKLTHELEFSWRQAAVKPLSRIN